MLGKIGEQLSSLTPSRYFFRVIAAGFLIVILVSHIPSTRNLLGPILRFSDLRHQVNLSTPTDSFLDSARLSVFNSGFGSAKNVVIHVNVQDGVIVRYQVDSQELYEAKTIDLENGVLNLWLDRLASGAKVDIEIIGTNFATDTVSLSAVSDQGSSVTIDSPNPLAQVDAYVPRLTRLFREAGEVFWQAPSMRGIKNRVSTTPALNRTLQVVRSDEFRTVGLAALIISCLIVIFLPEGFMLFIPFIAGFIVWLFFDFRIPTWWIIAALTLIILFVILFIIAASDEMTRGKTGLALFTILAVGSFGIRRYWNDTMSITWLISLATVFLTSIIIGVLALLSEETGSKGSSRSQDKIQISGLDTVTATQYERRIAELERTLEKKKDEYDTLLQHLVTLSEYLKSR